MADTHVALLRGINVGGKRRLPMELLRGIVRDAGGTDVRTYIQSGNVVFRAAPAVARRLPAAVAAAIEARCGYSAPVVTRTAADLARVVRNNPFLAEDVDEKRLHVAFVAAAEDDPALAEAAARLDPDRSPPDRIALRGREVYLHLPNGVARTRYTSAYLDACCGAPTTVRNWRTVRRLLEMAASSPKPP